MNSDILKRFTFVLGTAFLVTLLVLPAEARLAVAPLTIELEASSGETATGNLNLENTGEGVIKVNIQLVDWYRTPKGGLQFLPPGAVERSCADWLLYSPTSVTLKPGESRQVSVEIEVPQDASGDHWAMLLVTEVAEKIEDEETVSTRITVNYAIKILQRDPEGGQKDAKITGIEMADTHPLKLTVSYSNTGSSHLMTTGTVDIRDLQGETVREYEIDEFPALPGEESEITVESFEPLEPGQYYAVVIMDFGGDHLIQGGRPIEIPGGEGEEEAG